MELAVLTESQCHQVCHTCDRHRLPSAYTMVCGEDGRDIIEHGRERKCPLGRFVLENVPKATAAVRAPARVLEPREWPLRVKLIASRRRPGEAGVGDTLKRLLGPPGIGFEKAYEWLVGRPCGCCNRQAKLNRMYPYAGDGRAATTAV